MSRRRWSAWARRPAASRSLQQFFGDMPPESGLAFVVVMHLSPDYESNLANDHSTEDDHAGDAGDRSR